MSKRRTTARRTACPPGTTRRPAPVGLAGPRHLSALDGLARTAPLHPVLDADAPDHDCPIPPRAVADTLAGATAVLVRVGRQDLLDRPVLAGLAEAARHGWGVTVPPDAAKALWRFCDAFQDDEPRLSGAARGLRVIVG